MYASFSLLGAVRDVCQLLSDLAAAQWYCRSLYQSCGSIFGPILWPFWCHFGLPGVPGDPPGEPWGAFVPHLPPGTLPDAILGSFWGALGTPFGALLGAVFGLGSTLEALGEHFGSILAAFGRLSVSTSFLNL